MAEKFVLGLFAVCWLFAFSKAQQAWQVGQRVQTTSGVVIGMEAAKYPEVSAYLGIPFAQAPIGPLRWIKPQSFKSSTGINATKQAPSCRGSITNGSSPPISEDCLYLNLWTQPQKGESEKAVMVFIHGGGFETGSTSFTYGTKIVAREDVIVVVPAYRLGIFGFPDAPGLTDQNLGILDVRKALEWVRDNIANFGGDPNRVMLFGQSAGSMLVDFYSMAYANDPLVSGIIEESGSATSGFALSNNGSKWNYVSTALGCGMGPASVNCLRQKSDLDIFNAVGGAGKGKVSGPFAPVVDGKVVWKDEETITRAKKGFLAKVPYVFMVNSREMTPNVDKDVFNCPASIAAAARTANGVPAWRLRFYGNGTTGHSAELGFIFGAKADALTDYVQDTWAGFAKDPKNYLTKLGWPTYKPGGAIVRIGYGGEIQASTEPASVVDSICTGL